MPVGADKAFRPTKRAAEIVAAHASGAPVPPTLDPRDVLLDAALTLLLERPNLPKRVSAYAARWEQRLGELLALPEFIAWRTHKEGRGW